MKRTMDLSRVILAVLIVLPVCSVYAQTTSKKSLSEVPITYPGDTDKTIARRAQWIEAARKEGTVVWWTSTSPKEANQIADEFNKIYPFIKINLWRGQDVERVTKIEGEYSVGRVTCDIMEGGEPTLFPRWRKLGMPAQYVDIIPGIERWDRKSYSRFGDWVMPEHNAYTPQYNTRLVSAAEAPKSWEDLLNPKWKGQIALTPDMKGWYLLALGEKGWGVEKTEAYLRKLKDQSPLWAAGHSAGFNLLIAGEYKIMAESGIRYLFVSPPEKRKQVEWVRANPVPVVGGFYMLPSKAPHPNATRLFLEWYLSPVGSVIIEHVTGKGLPYPGSGTQLSKALEGLDLIYKTEELVIKAGELGLVDKFAGILGVTPE